MPSVDITQQPIVVEAQNDTSVVSFTENQVTVEVPSPAPVVEFGASATLVAGTGLVGGGYMLGSVMIGLSPATIASLLKADTALQPGIPVSAFTNDVGYLTAATVGAGFQPLADDLTYIANLTTTVFGRSFLELADATAARTLIGVYSTSDTFTKTEVNALIAGRAAASHTHGNADITSLAWSKLTDIPATFPPGAHTHLMADITGLTVDHGGLTGLADDDHTQYYNQVRGDARYSQLGHTHDYAASGHTHDYAPLVHTHSYLPLAGGFLTGAVVYDGAGYASFRNATNTVGADIGLLGGSADASLYIYQRFNASLVFGTSNTNRMTISGDGVVNVIGALRVNDTNVSVAGHTHSYLPLSGGTLTGDLYAVGGIYARGTSSALWWVNRANNVDTWAWYSDSGNAQLYRAGSGDVVVVDSAGHTNISGGLQATGGYLRFSTEMLTFDGDSVPHYGVAWYSDSRNLSGNSLAISGYGGLTFITQGAEQARLDGVGLNLAGYLKVAGKEVVRGSDTWLRLNQANDFTSGVYTPGNTRADGNANFAGQLSVGLDFTRHQLFQDGTSIQRYYTDNVPTCLHEFYTDTGTGGSRPIFIRFHQAATWYNRLRAENGRLSYVGGVDDTLHGMRASLFSLNVSDSIHLSPDSNSVRITSPYGYGNFGSENSAWFHMFTDRAAFYMGNALHVNGSIYRYGTSYAMDSDGFYLDGSANRLRASSGTYGTGELYGSKSGWAGLRLGAAYYAPYLMFSTSSLVGGFYSESEGWYLRMNSAGKWSQTTSQYLIPMVTWASYSSGSATFSRGTANPSGGSDGDVYFQYT